VSSPASTTGQADGHPPAASRPKRQILGPTGLIVMVAAILAFTAVSIVIELVHNYGRVYSANVQVVGQVPGRPNEYQVVFHITNRGSKPGTPDICDATLTDIRGERVGTASVTLKGKHLTIESRQTLDEPAIGTAASAPVGGDVNCHNLEPE
jgi:hypothetical protein